MTNTVLRKLSIALICLTFAFVLSAQNTPRWVSKGVKSINEQRSNDSYTVESFNTYNSDLSLLENKATDVLKKYVIDNYGADQRSISVELLSNNGQPVYEISYKDAYGNKNNIIAKRIDVFTDFDDYELNVYQFEYHQLYAISKPNVAPEFDQFTFSKNYKGVTTGMSLIPGMAQLYKGQDTKGYVIIGTEVFFAGATAIFDNKRRHCKKMITEDPAYAGSWNSKQNSWQNFEIGAISCFAVVYIYNLIDGLTSKGAKQVIVKKSNTPHVTMMPYATTNEAGMSVSLTF